MTISLNSYAKTACIKNIQASNVSTGQIFAVGATLRLYPSTVAYPTTPVDSTTTLPSGHIVSYTGLTYSTTGNTIIISSGTTTAATTAAGTFAWWAIVPTVATSGAVTCDSIGLSGTTSVVTVNTMTPTSGQSVQVAFNLTLA